MTRTTVRLDRPLLRRAATELGTTSPSETIDAALRRIVEEQQSREAVDAFRNLDLDLSADNLDGAWR